MPMLQRSIPIKAKDQNRYNQDQNDEQYDNNCYNQFMNGDQLRHNF